MRMAEYFYMRVSARDKHVNQKLTQQEKALQKYAKTHGLKYDVKSIYKEDCAEKNFLDCKVWIALEKKLKDGDTLIFKDISCFTGNAESGYGKYIQLMETGVHLVFIDNPSVCTDYIKQLRVVAEKQHLVDNISLEDTVKLLLYVELDRLDQERLVRRQRIKDGMDTSEKKPGRKIGTMEKLNTELEEDIMIYLKDSTVLQIDIMKKHNISRNTLKKYVKIIAEKMNKNVPNRNRKTNSKA